MSMPFYTLHHFLTLHVFVVQWNGIGLYRFHDAYFGMISSPGFRERFFVVSQK